MEDSLFTTLLAKSKEYMQTDRLFHDEAHINNVLKSARILIEKLGGDETTIITAVLFHDIRRDVDNHELIGANETRELLQTIPSFPHDKIEQVCTAIEHHEKGQLTHNEKIVADADKIDAFTELGIARGFMMLAKKGYTLKKGIAAYYDLLDKWFNELHFDESRVLAKTDYVKSKNFLEALLKLY